MHASGDIVLNEAFILQRIEPHLNAKRELSEIEFFELFAGLDLKEQYEVVTLMIGHNIELVDEKEAEAAPEAAPAPQSAPEMDVGWEHMLGLTNEELCVLAQKGDVRAKAAILKKNERFVYQAALTFQRQFSRTNLTVEDLFQEGNIGLLKAVERFDPAADFKFLTYAGYWINQQISRTAIDTGYMIRLPVHLYEKIQKLGAYRKKHPEADLAELTAVLRTEDHETTPEDVQLYLQWGERYLNTTSLNLAVGEDGETELQDLLPDQEAPSVEDMVGAALLREVCEEVLGTLRPREEKILRLRFGFDGGRPHTLEELGKEFQVTRERIRQIEEKALRKLRHPNRAERLEDFVT